MKNTTLTSERLQLRLLQTGDVADIFAYANDPEVSRNTAWSVHQSIKDTQAFLDYVLDRICTDSGRLRLVWGILEKGKGQVIGTLSFKQDTPLSGHVDYALARPYWGKGYVSEALAFVLSWLFEQEPQLQEIHSGCLSRNVGSVWVLEKNGFELVEQYVSKRDGKFGGELLETSLFVRRR